jgi:hypothetical protein
METIVPTHPFLLFPSMIFFLYGKTESVEHNEAQLICSFLSKIYLMLKLNQ